MADQLATTDVTTNPPAAGPAPLADAQGVLSEKWLEHPKIAEHRTSKSLQAIKDVPTLVGQVVNLEKALGRKRVVLPESDTDDAAFTEIFKALGVPDKPEGYPVLKPSDQLPEGLEHDPAFAATLTGWAHKLHLTPAQLTGLWSEIEAMNIAQHNLEGGEKIKAQDEAVKGLKTKWQATYSQRIQRSNTAATAMASPELLERIRKKGWLTDPDFVEYTDAFAEAISPDRIHARSDGTPDTGSLETKMNEKMGSKAYQDPEDPMHAAVQAEVESMMKQLVAAKKRREGTNDRMV